MVWNIPEKHDCHGLMYESLYILHLKIIIFGLYTWVIQHTLIDSMTEMQARELFHVFCHPNNEQDVTSQSPTPTTSRPTLSLSFFPHVPPGARKEAALGQMHARSCTLHKPWVRTAQQALGVHLYPESLVLKHRNCKKYIGRVCQNRVLGSSPGGLCHEA